MITQTYKFSNRIKAQLSSKKELGNFVSKSKIFECTRYLIIVAYIYDKIASQERKKDMWFVLKISSYGK